MNYATSITVIPQTLVLYWSSLGMVPLPTSPVPHWNGSGVSITLSTAIVLAVICCRHAGPSSRRRRRAWVFRRGGGGYGSATANVVTCEMEEFDATSFGQCSLSTTADDDVRRSQQSEQPDVGDRTGLPSRTRTESLVAARSPYD